MSNQPAVWIVDPCLSQASGHHYSAAVQLSDVFRPTGATVRLYSSRSFKGHPDDPEPVAAARRAFRDCFHDRTTWGWRRAHFLRLAQSNYRDLSRWAREQERAPELVVLPSADQSLILAVARFIAMRVRGRPPHLLIWLILHPRHGVASEDLAHPDQMAEYRQAFECLGRAIGGRSEVQVLCETESLAEVYRATTGFPITAARYVSPARPLTRTAAEENRQPHLICIGQYNSEKGYELLDPALEIILREQPAIRVTVHAARADQVAPELDLRCRLERRGREVRVSTAELSQREYQDLLASADLLLLPYDPRVYGSRGSGVFTEAERLGIPTVVTGGCEFAEDALAQGRSVAIEQYDAPCLASAVLRAIEALPDLRRRSRAWCETNATPVPLAERLMQDLLHRARLTAATSDQAEQSLARLRREFTLAWLRERPMAFAEACWRLVPGPRKIRRLYRAMQRPAD